MSSPGDRLRSSLLSDDITIIPGSYDALSAKLIERAGFQTTYVTGYGMAAAMLAEPDVGFNSVSDVVAQASRITSAVDMPVWCDIDQGWGPPHVVDRVVRRCAQVGVAGVDIDDQITEYCPYLPFVKELLPAEQMVHKVRAAVDAAESSDMMVTVKVCVLGSTYERDGTYREEFARRAEMYIEAGAFTCFGGWRDHGDLEAYAKTMGRLGRPALALMGPYLPQVPPRQLRDMGYRAAMYPLDILYAQIGGQVRALRALHERGDMSDVLDELIGHDDFMSIVDVRRIADLIDRHSGADGYEGAYHTATQESLAGGEQR